MGECDFRRAGEARHQIGRKTVPSGRSIGEAIVAGNKIAWPAL
jgi:hypothetical protein